MAPNKPPIAEGDQFKPIPPLVIDLLASRVWPRGCIKCAEIMDLEEQLDERVKEVVANILADVRRAREENNRRWEKFAKICRMPVVGNLFFKRFNAPKLLDEPPYYKHPAYIAARDSIEPIALQLETLKIADMEHWGDEKVKTDDGRIHDPDPGYTRRQCYEKGHTAFLPDKYDFNSAAGDGKFEEGRMVMCRVTKRLYPVNQCAIRYSDGKVFYYSPGTYSRAHGWFGFARV